jgi:hypothetical protein
LIAKMEERVHTRSNFAFPLSLMFSGNASSKPDSGLVTVKKP